MQRRPSFALRPGEAQTRKGEGTGGCSHRPSEPKGPSTGGAITSQDRCGNSWPREGKSQSQSSYPNGLENFPLKYTQPFLLLGFSCPERPLGSLFEPIKFLVRKGGCCLHAFSSGTVHLESQLCFLQVPSLFQGDQGQATARYGAP